MESWIQANDPLGNWRSGIQLRKCLEQILSSPQISDENARRLERLYGSRNYFCRFTNCMGFGFDGEGFDNIEDRNKHETTSHPKTYQCPHQNCLYRDRALKSVAALQSHLRVYHIVRKLPAEAFSWEFNTTPAGKRELGNSRIGVGTRNDSIDYSNDSPERHLGLPGVSEHRISDSKLPPTRPALPPPLAMTANGRSLQPLATPAGRRSFRSPMRPEMVQSGRPTSLAGQNQKSIRSDLSNGFGNSSSSPSSAPSGMSSFPPYYSLSSAGSLTSYGATSARGDGSSKPRGPLPTLEPNIFEHPKSSFESHKSRSKVLDTAKPY